MKLRDEKQVEDKLKPKQPPQYTDTIHWVAGTCICAVLNWCITQVLHVDNTTELMGQGLPGCTAENAINTVSDDHILSVLGRNNIYILLSFSYTDIQQSKMRKEFRLISCNQN